MRESESSGGRERERRDEIADSEVLEDEEVMERRTPPEVYRHEMLCSFLRALLSVSVFSLFFFFLILFYFKN